LGASGTSVLRTAPLPPLKLEQLLSALLRRDRETQAAVEPAPPKNRMGFFTYLAEQSFRTSATGERLFYDMWPWSRPFIVPDEDTEQRLLRKQAWILRIVLGGLFLQPLLLGSRPDVLQQTFSFLVYLVIWITVYWAAVQIVFARDLRRLQRSPVRLGLRSFYSQTAQRHSKSALFLGFMGSLLFVTGGMWILSEGANPAMALFIISFFALAAVAWGYALFLKSQSGDPQDKLD
jgi:hypothetical protein